MEWSSLEGDRGGLQGELVQLWRSWRAGVGSPGDDGARGWASWRAEEDSALGWAALGHKQMGLLRCQQIQVKNSTTLFTELCTHLFIRFSVSQRMCSLGWL